VDSIDVPIYRQLGQDSIEDALAELRRKQRGGILIEDRGRYRLLFAGDLLRARHDGRLNVQDVPGGEPAMVATEEHAAAYGLDLDQPLHSWQQYETILDAHRRRYAVPAPALPPITVRPAHPLTRVGGHTVFATATIVTRSEEYGALLRMTGGYECDGEPKHFFPEPYAQAGDNCPLYPECSRTDGSIPKVIASI
jgi:hypothetical protein